MGGTCGYHLEKLRKRREDQATEVARARAVTAAQTQAAKRERIYTDNERSA